MTEIKNFSGLPTNVFANPGKYIEEIIQKVRIPNVKRKKIAGKGIASIFLTAHCDAGCAHCFFKSGEEQDVYPREKAEYSDEGLKRLITFINQANIGYLMVIGGGEPFQRFPHVLKLVEKSKTDRIVLVTNGKWGQKEEGARSVIQQLYAAFKARKNPTHVVLRISVDKWHIKQLGYELVNNIIEVFKESFKDEEHFELQLHGLIGDTSLEEIAAKRGDVTIEMSPQSSIPDNETVMKISPNRATMTFEGGYRVQIGLARLFYSTMKPDLREPNAQHIQKAVEVFRDDMVNSTLDNPSIIGNRDGSYGLNWWFNYNGNVCLWGNQQLTDLYNVYTDDYDDFIAGCYNNIITYSFLDKGYTYRVERIGEVNPRAVLRSEVINIRDYAGAVLMEEKKTVLYYAIRVIQDYLKDGILPVENLQGLSTELMGAIAMDPETLKSTYAAAEYTLFDQYMDRAEFDEDAWKDLFTLVYLGHYDVSEAQVAEAIAYYNQRATAKITSIEEVKQTSVEHYRRLNERVTYMKLAAKQWCIDNA